MTFVDPLLLIFFLGLSFLLVVICLTAVLIVAIPALQELGRAARSVEKLADTLSRELPPTLEAIRLTGLEISELTDDVSTGVKSAGQVAKRVDESLGSARKQAQKVQVTTRSFLAGAKAAWRSLTKPRSSTNRRGNRLPPGRSPELDTPTDPTQAAIERQWEEEGLPDRARPKAD